MKHAVILAVAVGLALPAAATVALAQDAAQPDAAPAAMPQPKAAPAKSAKAKPADWTGTWSGSLAQVGRAKPFAFMVTLSGKTGRSSYADDHCAGKLVRAGSSGDYAFFMETITEGKFDAATSKGCIDGSLTFLKDAGGSLVMTWMAAHDGKAIVAYGTLSQTK